MGGRGNLALKKEDSVRNEIHNIDIYCHKSRFHHPKSWTSFMYVIIALK